MQTDDRRAGRVSETGIVRFVVNQNTQVLEVKTHLSKFKKVNLDDYRVVVGDYLVRLHRVDLMAVASLYDQTDTLVDRKIMFKDLFVATDKFLTQA